VRLDPRLGRSPHSGSSAAAQIGEADGEGFTGEEEHVLRVHVGDSELVKVLLEYFEQQSDCVAIRINDSEIEVSLIGSFRTDTHNAAVEDLVTGFRRSHPEARALRVVENDYPLDVL
jgi:hypothetical protein